MKKDWQAQPVNNARVASPQKNQSSVENQQPTSTGLTAYEAELKRRLIEQ